VTITKRFTFGQAVRHQTGCARVYITRVEELWQPLLRKSRTVIVRSSCIQTAHIESELSWDIVGEAYNCFDGTGGVLSPDLLYLYKFKNRSYYTHDFRRQKRNKENQRKQRIYIKFLVIHLDAAYASRSAAINSYLSSHLQEGTQLLQHRQNGEAYNCVASPREADSWSNLKFLRFVEYGKRTLSIKVFA